MSVNGLRRTIIVLLVLGLLAAATPAQIPPLNIPDSSLRAGLTSGDEQKIKERVDYHIKQLAEAENQDQVILATNGLMGDYKLYDSILYQYAYADCAAKAANRFFKKKNADSLLNRQKDINLAIAIAEMPQIPIQSVLETMVAHPNAAVRYLGWKGFRNIRRLLLSQAAPIRTKMFQTITSRAAKETSPTVICELIKMLNVPIASFGVPDDVLVAAQKTSYDLLAKRWNDWCRVILLSGEAEMPLSMTAGVNALASYSKIFPDKQKEILQMVITAAWCASKAYDEAGATGDVATNNTLLLDACERAMNLITDSNKTLILSKLTDPGVPARGAAVRRAVLDWCDSLKSYDVKEPNLTPPSDTTTQPVEKIE